MQLTDDARVQQRDLKPDGFVRSGPYMGQQCILGCEGVFPGWWFCLLTAVDGSKEWREIHEKQLEAK